MDPNKLYKADCGPWYDRDLDIGSNGNKAEVERLQVFLANRSKQDQESAQTERMSAAQHAAESQKHRQAMLRFLRIAMNLFKRTPHSDTCPAKNHLTDACDCGLAEIEAELSHATANVVLTSMGGK